MSVFEYSALITGRVVLLWLSFIFIVSLLIPTSTAVDSR